jgi:hypothetical protein
MKTRLLQIEKRKRDDALPEIIFCRNAEEVTAAKKRQGKNILFIREHDDRSISYAG